MELYKLKEKSSWIDFAGSDIFIYAAIDTGGRLLLVNNQFREIYRTDHESNAPIRFSQLFLPEEQQHLENKLKLLMLNPEKAFNYVLSSRLPDGQFFSVHWEFKLNRDYATHELFFTAIGYPLSRNKAVKFALSGVVHHFEILFEKNPDILVVMDRNFNISRLNPAAVNFFSKGNIEIPAKGMNLLDLKNRYNIDLMILLHSFNEGKDSLSHSEVLQVDNEYYAVNVAVSDQFFSFLMKDITESKQTIRKLRDAQLNLRQLLDNSMDLVIYFNAMLAITYFNNEAAKSFQTHDGDIMREGADVRSFFPKELKVGITEFEDVVRRGESISKDVLVANRWLRINLYPIKDLQNGNSHYALTASDVTNIKEMQRQLEMQNESLKKINWRHSHELRAPLANILGLIQLLERSEPIEKADFDVLLDGLKISSQQLDRVIHEIVSESFGSLS